MTSDKSEISKSDKEKTRPMLRQPFDDIFENIRRDVEYAFA
jgi:hypothetical protein